MSILALTVAALGASILGVSPLHAKAGGPVIVPQPKAGEPLLGLTPDQLQRFEEGLMAFDRTFQVSEGLGPGLNQNSCASCHSVPTVGGAGSITVTRFGFAGEKGGFDPLEELGGSLLQSEAIDPMCQEVIPPPPISNVQATRSTPSVFGFGLIEAVNDADIAGHAQDPPGISGRVHMVQLLEDPMGPSRVGRFGWKAQVATVLSFSGDASLNEMGITNDLIPTENAPNGDLDLLAMCDTIPDPEDVADVNGIRFIDRITDFQRFLAAPPQTPKSGMSGEATFINIGCAECHVPSYFTPDDPGLEDAIRNKEIKPYSDFLLHDMGLLFDGIVQGDAQAGEIRTPPLWGLKDKDPMLHDASVAGMTFEERVAQAITDHGQIGSEAKPSVDTFNFVLSAAERNAVIAFLGSLGQAEFDDDGDNDTELNDFFGLLACSEVVDTIMPDDHCAIHDIDQDGSVAFSDLESFMLVYVGARQDCNCNGVVDLVDVFNGTGTDADQDGILDECVAAGHCFTDVDCSDTIDSADLALVLGAWGECAGGMSPCASDINGDGDTNSADLALLLGGWGGCL